MTEHSHFPYTNTYCSTPHNTKRKHNIYHTPYTIIQYTSTLQGIKTLSSTTAATQQHFHRAPQGHYNRHTSNMRHIHTYIISMHLATRGNNKILRTPTPHISSSEKILPRLTRRTLDQPRTNQLITNHTYKSRRQIPP